jgi:hypothetical protein
MSRPVARCADSCASDVRCLFSKVRFVRALGKPEKCRKLRRFLMAGGLGFEPRLTESESAVLPLNYPPIGKAIVDCSIGPVHSARFLVPVGAGLERRYGADTSRTSCAPFQAATARTPLMPCVGPTCRTPRWRSPPAHRRRRREIPRAGTHDRGTARRSRAPPCRRYESRW